MRVVALHAIHPSFDHRVMLRQIKFTMHIKVALEAGARVLSRIHYKFPSSPSRSHMLTRRSMTRLATCDLREFNIPLIESPVSARWKCPYDVRVTIHTSRVTHKVRARNRGWRIHRPLYTRAGDEYRGGNRNETGN